MKFALALAAAVLVAAAPEASNTVKRVSRRQDSTLPVVTQRGNAFYTPDDTRFFIRGIAYQPGGASNAADPLIDLPSLERDIEQFVRLGINTIRIYTIDNSANHQEGMQMLADAGIYLALDVNTPTFSINRADADSLHLSYNDKYLQHIFATVDSFAEYSNLLLFFAGNEVVNEPGNTNAAPYVKAVIRDMKSYIANRGYRQIPVGYAAADVAENINEQLEYFDCGAEITRADFFGMNDYSWCDPTTWERTDWGQKVQRYSGYGAPMFLAEFGCIEDQRQWNEIASLFSTNMSSVYSGGIAYEYSVEENNFGMVTISPNGDIQIADDFELLIDAFAAATNPTGEGGASTGAGASDCPARSDDWEVANLTIPAPPAAIQAYMDDGAGQGLGLNLTDSSQWGGLSSSTDSYSDSWIEMDGSEPTGTNAPNPSATGSGRSSGTPTGGASNDTAGGGNGASGRQLASMLGTVIAAAGLGAALVVL